MYIGCNICLTYGIWYFMMQIFFAFFSVSVLVGNLVLVRVIDTDCIVLKAGGMGGSPSFFSKLSAIIRNALNPTCIMTLYSMSLKKNKI